MRLTRVQLGELNRLAATTHFGALPLLTMCQGSLPDFATSFVRVGARTVRVRGGCIPAYQRLFKALAGNVRFGALERSAATEEMRAALRPPSTNHGARAMRAYESMRVRVPARPTASRAACENAPKSLSSYECVEPVISARSSSARLLCGSAT